MVAWSFRAEEHTAFAVASHRDLEMVSLRDRDLVVRCHHGDELGQFTHVLLAGRHRRSPSVPIDAALDILGREQKEDLIRSLAF